jgi:hypothetical protein
MTTTQEYDQESRPLPSANDGRDASYTNPWRISKGKLFRGRPSDGTEEEREFITGRIVEMQYNSGTSDDGKVYQYAAVILENADDGRFKVHVNTSSKTSSATFMEALCQCTKGDDITITPKLGDPKPGYSAPTFANISRMDYNTGKWVRCKAAERRDYDDWYEEFLNHPCLVVRNKDEAADSVKPVEDPYADSPDEKFENYVLERSWPAVNLYPEAWIAVIGKILKGQYTGSLTEEQFNTLEEALNKFKTAPQSVLDAAKSIPDLDPSNL